MTIRFLQTVASEAPDCPFMAGQVISVAAPSSSIAGALRNGLAEIVKPDDERAEAPAFEIPEPRTKRSRKRGA